MALHGEELADSAVEKGPGPEKEQITEQYEGMIGQFQQAFKNAKSEASSEGTRGILCLLGPDPVEAIDVMENLPKGGACLRLIPGKGTGTEQTAFSLTPDDLEVTPFPPLKSAPDAATGGLTVVALEDPSRLDKRARQTRGPERHAPGPLHLEQETVQTAHSCAAVQVRTSGVLCGAGIADKR